MGRLPSGHYVTVLLYFNSGGACICSICRDTLAAALGWWLPTKVIEFDNVTKYYGNFRALDGVSFTIDSGSISGFVGSNGSGKTTSIHIAAGLLRQSSGSVYILGENPWNSKTVHRKVFFLLDSFSIPGDIPLMSYLLHCSKIYHFDRSTIVDALKDIGLYQFRNLSTRRYSAGMLQKAQLSLALCAGAEVVVADEPASNLDPAARMNLYERIKRLNRENGITFFISSHILTELDRVVDHIVIINRGRLSITGRMSDLLKSRRSDRARIHVSDSKAASALLEAVEIDGDTLTIELKGKGAGEAISLLEQHGIEVYSFRRTGTELEEIFREATHG